MKKQQLKQFKKEFGNVEYEGKEIVLAENAIMTNRVLSEYSSSLQYQGDGQTYMVEYSAQGYMRETQKPVTVFWHFEIARPGIVESEEAYAHDMLEENYDWNQVYDVQERDE